MSEILLNLPHWAIVDPDLREGERTLAGGFRFRTRNHRVTEIRAPRVVDPRGFGGAIQRDALLASGERLGVELGPDMWRVDHDCYTLRFPRRLSLALDQAA